MANNLIARALKEIIRLGLESFGRYYSTYRATVFDNVDPEGLNRLLLIIPEITNNEYHGKWAYPKHNYAGKGYGSQLLPSKGDLVWVEFEHGSPESPIWSHGYFGLGEKPSNDQELSDVKCHWFITPGGIKVKLNDTTSAIHIETSNGDFIELNKNSVSINTGKKIILGNLDDAKYFSVIGDEVKEAMQDLLNGLSNTINAMQLDILESIALGQPFLVYTQLNEKLGLIKGFINDAQGHINKSLSTQVKLEK